MYLKRLEIQGFKSFAKKTILEFGQGITAIVGPNGSGKSNAADCLRWVLGEQSTKLMRGKKSEDVIFAGSDKKGRAGVAEVVATFDNRDHKIPIDVAEVAIGRRITRSGESEYLLNGTRVRLLDIIDLVLKSNIGTSRYTVIGQGTIDQMILAGPSEIKNLIDEASGVKTYFIKRDRTLRRLEQTAQNLMRAEDLLRELEPRVRSLRRQAKRMEARAEIESELHTALHKQLGGQWWQLHQQVAKFDTELNKLKEQRTVAETAISTHIQKIEQHEQENAGALLSYQQLQQESQLLQNQKNILLEQVSLVRGKMSSLQGASGDSESLQIESHKLEQRTKDLQTQIIQATTEADTARQKIADQQKILEQINQKILDLQDKLHNPQEADWALIDQELDAFDQDLVKFQEIMHNAQDVSAVYNLVSALINSWQKLKTITKKTVVNPGQKLLELQQNLQALSQNKDALQNEINNFGLLITKSDLSKEFLSSQLLALQNDKLRIDLELKRVVTGGGSKFTEQLIVEENILQAQIDSKSMKQQELEEKLQGLYVEENTWKQAIAEDDKKFRLEQDQLGKIRDQESLAQVEKAKLETQLQAIELEVSSVLGQQELFNIKQQQIVPAEPGLVEKITKLKKQIELIGGVDELTMQEYHETENRYTNLQNQVTDLHKSMSDLRKVMDELDEHIKIQFNTAFHKVNLQFEQYFRMLFNGGRAHLSLVKASDDKNPDELIEETAEEETTEQLRPEEKIVAKYETGGLAVSGVDIKATPPGKKLSAIQSLSGGERSLTSIALLCSLLTCFPSPFVVLDEVDAALDEANTVRFGQILGKLSDQTQFITITHNRETMSHANILYGVTMGDDGVSQLLSIKIDQASVYAK